MSLLKIEYQNNVPVKTQISQLKKGLVQSGVILGKDFTLEMASLITQIESLASFYDTQRYVRRFRANVRTLELVISNESKYCLDYELCKMVLEKITSGFDNSLTDQNKKVFMFKLLFFHLDLVFQAYKAHDKVASNLDIKVDANKEKFYNQKYKELSRLIKTPGISSEDRNKYKANLRYYKLKLLKICPT